MSLDNHPTVVRDREARRARGQNADTVAQVAFGPQDTPVPVDGQGDKLSEPASKADLRQTIEDKMTGYLARYGR